MTHAEMHKTIGILGGGQLGRMLALAGYPLGLRFRVLDPSPDAPTRFVADHIVGPYDDPDTLQRFADGVDVITYEFENIPVETVQQLATTHPVSPPPDALIKAQDRLNEKTFFQSLGIPTSRFIAVESRSDLEGALAEIGFPAILKTRRMGYDGKGQARIATLADIAPAWERLGNVPCIVEQYVRFSRELSILAARGRNGTTVCYPLVENTHQDGILFQTIAPAPDTPASLQAQAERYVTRVVDALAYVGVVAVELFEVEGTLVANEMAPRVHNSGHWTIEGAQTSQFSNHLRAIMGWPLGATTPLGTTTMTNILGTLPDISELLANPHASVHLYDKAPRPGRKLGHVSVRTAHPVFSVRSVRADTPPPSKKQPSPR
jgi:5-(carboxyamino)imidazole ribonucleotide synthase